MSLSAIPSVTSGAMLTINYRVRRTLTSDDGYESCALDSTTGQESRRPPTSATSSSTATAGTVAAGADVSVFFVAVFRTDDYDAATGEENHRDYVRFMERAGGQPIETDRPASSSYRLTVDGKALVCIYQYYGVR